MRRLRAAILVSVTSHATALAWIAHDGGVMAVPLRARPASTPAPSAAPPNEALTVVLFDDRGRAPDAAVAPVRATPDRAATSSSNMASAAKPASAASAHEAPGSTLAISTGKDGEPQPAPGKPHSSWMTMRTPEGPTANGLSPEFVTRFLEGSKPLAPAPDIPWERLTDEIKDLRHHHGGPNPAQIVALNQQLADEELKPSGSGTYSASKETFTASVDADGTTHLKDKPGQLDSQDRLMLSHGTDPYGRNKLAFLDRTRDQRAAVGERQRHVQLAHSVQLMQRNIDRLWATTTDVAGRKVGLFELWDDCAETGSDELVAGGSAARTLVVGAIRGRLRGADAYTAAELAELNAHRRSKAVFAPYE